MQKKISKQHFYHATQIKLLYFSSLSRAERMQCINANWPDLYGHYREAKFTQTKHHWWWKANRVFDQLRATKKFDGKVTME